MFRRGGLVVWMLDLGDEKVNFLYEGPLSCKPYPHSLRYPVGCRLKPGFGSLVHLLPMPKDWSPEQLWSLTYLVIQASGPFTDC